MNMFLVCGKHCEHFTVVRHFTKHRPMTCAIVRMRLEMAFRNFKMSYVNRKRLCDLWLNIIPKYLKYAGNVNNI